MSSFRANIHSKTSQEKLSNAASKTAVSGRLPMAAFHAEMKSAWFSAAAISAGEIAIIGADPPSDRKMSSAPGLGTFTQSSWAFQDSESTRSDDPSSDNGERHDASPAAAATKIGGNPLLICDAHNRLVTMETPRKISATDAAKLVEDSNARAVDVAAIFASTAPNLAPDEIEKVASYRVPRPAPDGACSRPDDLDPEPFRVLDTLVADGDADRRAKESRRLYALHRVCAELAKAIDSEWVGVYETMPGDGKRVPDTLMKLAYVGAPSRAYFPLTEDFVSNNSTVGMTGNAVVIQDVRKLPSDAPFYVCDPVVLSEVCAPLFHKGKIIGIVDVEAWKADHFTDARVAMILDTCRQIGDLGLLR